MEKAPPIIQMAAFSEHQTFLVAHCWLVDGLETTVPFDGLLTATHVAISAV